VAALRILTVNVGSSSVKLRVVADDEPLVEQDLAASEGQAADAAVPAEAVRSLAERVGGIDAFAHRIVHGGPDHHRAIVVDDEVLADLEELNELAPLHNAPALAVLRHLRSATGRAPHVACFDTAFHAGIPEAARRYAVPAEWTEDLGVHRYGFHGLNHAYASRRAADLLGGAGELRIVVCHLGSGASLAAVVGGRCVDTTMGFTPLEGLVMATRSGDVDPGALLWVQQRLGLSPEEMAEALNHRSGLLGLSGRTGDLRELLARRAAGDTVATTAIAVYLHRLRKGIASMAAAAGGLDALVFTAGVGEGSPAIRAEACSGLAFLGIDIDRRANDGHDGHDTDVATAASGVRVLVIGAAEEIQMAREAQDALRAG
jgi:acetate kinase